MKTGFDSRKGFTLIEVLVMTGIIVVLSGAVLFGGLAGQKRHEVTRAVQQVTADLRRAQNLAISGKTQGGVSPAGYGLYVNAGNYALFYNQNTNKQHNGASVVLETIALPSGVNLGPTGTSIYFVPPDPTTYINGSASGSLVFTVSGAAVSKTITIYASGRID